MPDLLLELFSEEIPARMQGRAAGDLKRLVTDALVDAGLVYEGARAFATPRRLALNITGLPARQADMREEKKGPRVGAPEKALTGFLKNAGLSSIGEAKIVSDPKKGDFYVAVIEKTGAPAEQVIAALMPAIIEKFPWPKSMRWGNGTLRWVRPLQSIVCLFGPETEETVVVPFAVDGLQSGNATYGHRFMAPEEIEVRRFEDYAASLEKARVVLDPERRADIILHDARDLALAAGLELVEDEALLAETAGLVEWPVVLMGSFDEAFLQVPAEVLTTAMKNHQKCFSLRDPRTDKLANRFLLVSNLVAEDGGKAIVAGNERVIAARLSDAKFFWETDLKTLLADRVEKLKEITFHEKLGTQFERVERLQKLAAEIAPLVKADAELASRAALLAKADLVTEMVGEFPELQGLMGRYYAQAQGEPEAVARAIEDHYKPQGPSDEVPSDPVTIAVALADKLDTLTGFWAIDEKPTGSKDPYALRRAALGVVRIILENNLRISLIAGIRTAVRITAQSEVELLEKIASFEGSPSEQREFLEFHKIPFMRGFSSSTGVTSGVMGHPSYFKFVWFFPEHFFEVAEKFTVWKQEYNPPKKDYDLLAFFADRLKVHLRDAGARHDLIDAVFSLGGQDDLLMIVRRVEALGRFLDTENGANLLAGVKRGTNILRIEEKKDGRSYDGEVDHHLLGEQAEKELANVLDAVVHHVEDHVEREDFEGAMAALAELRPAVDAFFDHVTVNAEDAALRENRLKLLNRLREATLKLADFSKIEG